MDKPVRYHHKGVDWDSEPLGDVPDRKLAEKHGVTVVTVILARKRRGIESYTKRHGTAEENASLPGKKQIEKYSINWDEQPLGERSDRQLGKDLGIPPWVVRGARVKRDIPVYEGSRKYVRKGIDWDNQPLGKVHDKVLAEKLGVKRNTVYLARRSRNIQLDEALLPYVRVDWDKAPLGKEPDKLIALTNGCSPSAVAHARAKRGIPPCPPRKRQSWEND